MFLVDKQIMATREKYFKGDTCQGRPMGRCPSVPVRFRDHAQDPRGVLGMSFSFSLLLMHSTVPLVEERMSQVASTALEHETHFCPGLAVEPVSRRCKDRNSWDLSFRFHECWSSGTGASDGSNSVSIFGAGWTRTKYSRPISSCRIGSGNISASRAYCERCAAIAAIFCWT